MMVIPEHFTMLECLRIGYVEHCAGTGKAGMLLQQLLRQTLGIAPQLLISEQ